MHSPSRTNASGKTFSATSRPSFASRARYTSPIPVASQTIGLDGSEHTLEQVGQTFAVTRERIRQIEAKALRKLRHPSRSNRLRAFLKLGSRDSL
jgi:hypothetical protein